MARRGVLIAAAMAVFVVLVSPLPAQGESAGAAGGGDGDTKPPSMKQKVNKKGEHASKTPRGLEPMGEQACKEAAAFCEKTILKALPEVRAEAQLEPPQLDPALKALGFQNVTLQSDNLVSSHWVQICNLHPPTPRTPSSRRS